MDEFDNFMADNIMRLKDTATGYGDRLVEIKGRLDQIKDDDTEKDIKQEHGDVHVQNDNKPCTCRILVDLMKDQKKGEEYDRVHKELLQANRDVMCALTTETKSYRQKYDHVKAEFKKQMNLKIASQKKILKCPRLTFDRETKHKDVMMTEDGALYNRSSNGRDTRHDKELTHVTGAVANKCFSRNDIAYFGIKADVQIIRNKTIEKARLYDIFDVYIGPQDVIDKVRDPGVLYQTNMLGINLWYSNMGQQVLLDVLSNTKHVERYVLESKVKHGDSIQIELSFLVDMPRETIHVFDNRKQKLIGTVTRLNTSSALWPAVQMHHCYYEPQYFETKINFYSTLEDVKDKPKWRKYLLTLIKEREASFFE